MTMLDRMRRHKSWLKWSLALVVVTFVALYIPEFTRNSANGASPYGVVASVDGRDITVARFRRTYQQQMNMYRNAYGGKIDDDMLRRFGIDQQVVQQLIKEEAALAEAGRQGISASDAEVRAKILSLPVFQENGQFIGDARYRQILQSQNPPLNPSDFEDEVRRGITVEKLQGALTDWITVADKDVDAEFNRRNDKVKLAVVSFPADKFKDAVAVTDADISAHFEANKEQYRVPEKRKVKYALIELEGIRLRTNVSAQDIQKYYDDNRQQYSTPEQVQSSHILLKTGGKDDATVKKLAEELLAKVKGGADFAALAKNVSEDEVSAAKGGELGFSARGDMVKEFDDVAFSLAPGQISDLVKTQFGYHIIKGGEKKPASERSLDEVRVQIEDTLKSERAQKEAEQIASDLAGKLPKPQDLDTVAKPRGLTVAETPFFSRSDTMIPGLGVAQAVTQRVFELKQGEVSEAVRTGQGFAFLTLTGTEESKLPTMDEVKARVRADVQRTKAVEAARQKAASALAQFKSGDFNAAARAAGLEVKTSELVIRGTALPDIGINAAVDAAAFALPSGGVSEPIVTDNGAVIVKVLMKESPSAEALKTGRGAIKDQLLNQQKQRFFEAYMSKARERMTIRSNPEVLAQVIG